MMAAHDFCRHRISWRDLVWMCLMASGGLVNIGLTYDLRSDYLAAGLSEEDTAEFDGTETIDGLEGTLQGLGYKTVRIGNVRNLIHKLATGERWDLVFNIAEGLYGFGREAQVPAILEAYNIPYTFSDPSVLSVAMHKGMTKRVLRGAGIPTPAFAEVHSLADLARRDWVYPLFAKPVAEGTGKGVSAASRVDQYSQLEDVCRKLLDRFQQPVLVENFLPGREFTVGILGTGDKASVLGVMEVTLLPDAEPHGYSYANKAHYERVVNYKIVNDSDAHSCAQLALKAWHVLGCRDGGRIDMRMNEKGEPSFIEVNPLAGLNPRHSDLPILCQLCSISYSELVKSIVQSACERVMGAR